MKTLRPILFLVIALLVGWAVGSYSTEHFYDKWIRRYQTHKAFEGVNERLTVLNALRAGDTNGTAELLESQMDGQIMLLAPFLQEMPAGQLQPQNFRLLTQLRDYRAAHPRKSGQPEIDQIIAVILSSTNSQTHP
jgi:thiaminase